MRKKQARVKVQIPNEEKWKAAIQQIITNYLENSKNYNTPPYNYSLII